MVDSGRGSRSQAVAVYPNINHTEEVNRLERKARRLQRGLSRQQTMNKKEGSRYSKTRNGIKRQRELLKVMRRLTNIRENYLHQITRALIDPELAGVQVLIAGRFYASSKPCSNCGHIKTELKLKDRTYRCAECGLIIDRDLNAAFNLKKYPFVSGEFKPVERQTTVSSLGKSKRDETGMKH